MAFLQLFKGGARKKHGRILDEIIQLQNRHNLATDENLIKDAFAFASRIHERQKRKDGQEYIIHPLAVAQTCSSYWLDDVSIAAALLHDTIEDAEGNKLTTQNLAEEFGPEVASIVEGVTKLKNTGQDRFSSQIESLKKILSTAAREDIRTIIIKIFDRHDNVKSIDVFRKLKGGKEKQKRIDYETQQFYIPIAQRLGLYKVAREMEDNLMRALNARTYNEISKWVRRTEGRSSSQVNNVVQQIRMSLENAGVDCIDKFYHKGIYQIYSQLRDHKLGLENLHNITAFNLTLIVPTEDDCYRTVGVIHRLFPHLRDSVFDFINNPKVNGYQSFHTNILVPELHRLQVLIRTPEMDTRNHLGLIANIRTNRESTQDELVQWIDELVSSFDVIGHKDLLRITSQLHFAEIEVVTPKGEQVHLPQGSTALDFAFHIHSEIALHARHAVIDGKERKLNTVLKKGQRVRIATDDKETLAKPHWFNWVSDSTSRLALKKHFKKVEKKQIEDEAKKFAAFCKEKLGIKVSVDSPMFDGLYQGMGYTDRREFLEDLYTGRLMYEFVVPHIVMGVGFRECKRLCKLLNEQGIIPLEETRKIIKECGETELQHFLKATINSDLEKKATFSEYVDIEKIKFPLPVNFAHCCHPQSPTPIVSVTSKGKGAVIHRSDCGSISALQEYGAANLSRASWKKNVDIKKVFIKIEGHDRPNLLHDLTHLFHDVKSNILKVSIDVRDESKFFGEILFEVSDVISQEILANRFRSVKSLTVTDIKIIQ
ncbi:MAG: HD domain-containing protein [Pseudomonadota bacterium]